jgi:hypothetical protein
MIRSSRLFFAGVVLLGALVAGPAQEAKGPAREVLDLAREAEAGKDVAARAAALKKHFGNVRAAMRLFNPRSAGGLGFGPRGVAIEWKLLDLGEAGISAAELKKELAELRRIAGVSLVVAEITRTFAPEKPFLGRGKKEWERDVEAMKAASRELLKALQAGSPKDVQAAAGRINNACNNCHDGKK